MQWFPNIDLTYLPEQSAIDKAPIALSIKPSPLKKVQRTLSRPQLTCRFVRGFADSVGTTGFVIFNTQLKPIVGYRAASISWDSNNFAECAACLKLLTLLVGN